MSERYALAPAVVEEGGMKLAQVMFVGLILGAVGSAFAQEGNGYGPPHAVRIPEQGPGKTPRNVKTSPAAVPAVARPVRPARH
jgi:hypothetical protein